MKDQLVLGVLDISLRKRLLQEDELSFKKATRLALQFGTLESQNNFLSSALRVSNVNSVNNQGIRSKSKMKKSNSIPNQTKPNVIHCRSLIIQSIVVLPTGRFEHIAKRKDNQCFAMKRSKSSNKVNMMDNEENSIPDLGTVGNMEIGISINDVWVGNILDFGKNKDRDKLVIQLSLQGKKINVLLDSIAAYNILDKDTAKALGPKCLKLLTNAFLRSITGGRLPITTKVVVLLEVR